MDAARAFWKKYPDAEIEKALADLPSTDWIGKGPHSTPTGLAAISLTQQGRSVLADVFSLYANQKLAIASLHSPQARQLVGQVNAGGLYQESVVYVDETAPLLAYATTLFHELVHARTYLSSDAGKAAADALAEFNNQVDALAKARAEGHEITPEQRERCRASKRAITPILLKSEHEAYLAQNAFLAEFERFDEGFGPLIEELTAREYWVAYPMREFDFQYLMSNRNGGNLPPAEVEAYLRAHPFNGSRR
jgi:hypothetical protein